MTATRLAVGVEEVAEMIGLSERTVWTEISEGRLRSFKARGRRLVRVSQIEAYLDRRELLTTKRDGAR
jgi:excisionase family DNA binding protein